MIKKQAFNGYISQLHTIIDASDLNKSNSLKSIRKANYLVSFLFFIMINNFSQLHIFYITKP